MATETATQPEDEFCHGSGLQGIEEEDEFCHDIEEVSSPEPWNAPNLGQLAIKQQPKIYISDTSSLSTVEIGSDWIMVKG